MELKKTLPLMLVIFLGVLAYNSYLRRYHPEWWATAPQAANPSIEPISGTGAPITPSISNPTTGISSATAPSMSPASHLVGKYSIAVLGEKFDFSPVTIGSLKPNDPQYALGLNLSPTGASLDSACINSQKAPDRKETYTFQQAFSTRTDLPSLGTQTLTINGFKLNLNGGWILESSSADSATYGLDIVDSDVKPINSDLKPAVHISRTWQLETRDKASAGYNVTCTYHVRNLTDQPLKIQLDFDGPTMPPRESERSDDRQVASGYDAGNAVVAITQSYPAEFKPGADLKNITLNDKGQRLLWTGESSQYFSAIIQPQLVGQIQSVQAQALNHTDDTDTRQIGMVLETAELTIPPQTLLDIPLNIFLGPKDRPLMEGDHFSAFPLQFNKLIGTSGGPCGFCSFPFLIDFLVKLLGIFDWVFHDWGVAIIVLVIIVRAILHPITKSSQVSMMGMQKMGPEMERLKKKYADDKDGLAKAQMQMWKEMGISPVLGCLPMFLQTPIWIALYSALQSELRLRQAPFLWGFTWIHDLSRPDRLIEWDAHAFKLPIIGMNIASLNLLPILIGIVFVINQQMQPQPPTMTPEQAQQRKMMKWMSLLFPFFLYLAPSGLNLYILTSTTIGIFESKIIRKHIKEREEAEKKVTIIDGPTDDGPGGKRDRRGDKPKAPPGKLGSLWANLQQRLADAQREAEKRNKKK
jgi:YidC/Oxa1 family membrane protein insertase